METPVIQFVNVSKAFGPKVILDKVSFDVRQGETLAVIGPSGTGKSTVLKMLIGLLAPDSGEILIKKQNVVNFKEKEWDNLRRHMGMVFQYSALFDFLNVGENVAFGLRQHTERSEEEIKARVAELLEQVGLAGTQEVFPAELSGGMKKRVGLARALALDPDIIYYDEPTAGLDPIMANNISRLILQTKERLGVTSILVTHDMASAFLAADRILLLADGHVAFVGTVEETKRSTHPLVKEFIRGDDVLSTKEQGGANHGQ